MRIYVYAGGIVCVCIAPIYASLVRVCVCAVYCTATTTPTATSKKNLLKNWIVLKILANEYKFICYPHKILDILHARTRLRNGSSNRIKGREIATYKKKIVINNLVLVILLHNQ